MQSRWKTLARPALLLASVALALVFAEFSARALRLAPDISRINPAMKKSVFRVSDNPLLGYVYKENYRDTNANLVTSYPYINAHGFRDVERKTRKPDGIKRILVLGDSVISGHLHIRELDDLMTRQLEKMLGEDKFEVLNLGITGYCTRGEVELLKEKGLQFDPDLVVLVFFANDYIDLNMELGHTAPPAPVQVLFIRSHLFRYAAVKLDWFDLRKQLGVQEIAGELLGVTFQQEPDRIRELRESEDKNSATVRNHLEAMGSDNVHASLPVLKALSEEHGFKVVIGLWPLFQSHGIYDAEAYRVRELVAVPRVGDLEIERLAVKHGIPFFRFSHFFNEDYQRRVKEGLLREKTDPWDVYCDGDQGHPNPLGAEVGAKALKTVLEHRPDLLE